MMAGDQVNRDDWESSVSANSAGRASTAIAMRSGGRLLGPGHHGRAAKKRIPLCRFLDVRQIDLMVTCHDIADGRVFVALKPIESDGEQSIERPFGATHDLRADFAPRQFQLVGRNALLR